MQTSTVLPVPLIIDALDICIEAHRGQFRKDGRPYIEHPLEVACLLYRAGINDPKIIAGGLLHDAIEDGPGHISASIIEHVGHDVYGLVMTVTDDQNLTSEERKANQLLKLAGAERGALLIKLADRVSNLASPRPDWQRDRRLAYAIHSQALGAYFYGLNHYLEDMLWECLRQPVWN